MPIANVVRPSFTTQNGPPVNSVIMNPTGTAIEAWDRNFVLRPCSARPMKPATGPAPELKTDVGALFGSTGG